MKRLSLVLSALLIVSILATPVHAQSNPPVEVFPESEPGKQHGKDAFGIQQEGGTRRRHACQAGHQQHRSDDAPRQYCSGEP